MVGTKLDSYRSMGPQTQVVYIIIRVIFDFDCTNIVAVKASPHFLCDLQFAVMCLELFLRHELSFIFITNLYEDRSREYK